MNTFNKKKLSIGTTLISGLIATASVAAEVNNPFAMQELNTGYMQISEAKDAEGKCGEGKCGGTMMPGNEEKMVEGNCAGNKPMPNAKKKPEAKCGEAKCGEGKCGDNKKS